MAAPAAPGRIDGEATMPEWLIWMAAFWFFFAVTGRRSCGRGTYRLRERGAMTGIVRPGAARDPRGLPRPRPAAPPEPAGIERRGSSSRLRTQGSQRPVRGASSARPGGVRGAPGGAVIPGHSRQATGLATDEETRMRLRHKLGLAGVSALSLIGALGLNVTTASAVVARMAAGAERMVCPGASAQKPECLLRWAKARPDGVRTKTSMTRGTWFTDPVATYPGR